LVVTEPRLTDRAVLRRLRDVCRSVVSEHDLDAVLRRVLEEGRAITGATHGALRVLNDGRDGDGPDRFITTGTAEETQAALAERPEGRGLSVPILIGREAYGNLYVTEKADGQEFDEVDEEAVGVLAEIAGVAIDNARRYQQLEGRRAALERAVTGLEATTEIARAIGDETELDPVLELIAARGRALVNARGVVILLADGDELKVVTVAGDIEDAVVGRRLPVSKSLYGEVLQSRQPRRIQDLPSRLHAAGHAIGVTASVALAVPLVFRGNALGVFVAYDHEHGPSAFVPSEEQLLMAFAASAAIAVGTAKTVAREHLRHSIQAAELERRRWARELHDETLQGLGALYVLLSSGIHGDLEGAVRQALVFMAEQIASLRSLISDLRPAVLDELGVQPALEALAERITSATGLHVALEVDLAYGRGESSSRLLPEIEDAMYRLVQEALTNVSKHAQTERAAVSVRESDGRVMVEVRDYGVGFDLKQITGGGFGLIGMRERAGLVEGSLSVASAPGEGTTVRIHVPAKHVADGPR
jgi:signal transduction histidine kinase